MTQRRNSKSHGRKEVKAALSKNGRPSDSAEAPDPARSWFSLLLVLALLGLWSSMAVVYFDVVDYDSVLGKLSAYDSDGDGDFDLEDAKVLLDETRRAGNASGNASDRPLLGVRLRSALKQELREIHRAIEAKRVAEILLTAFREALEDEERESREEEREKAEGNVQETASAAEDQAGFEKATLTKDVKKMEQKEEGRLAIEELEKPKEVKQQDQALLRNETTKEKLEQERSKQPNAEAEEAKEKKTEDKVAAVDEKRLAKITAGIKRSLKLKRIDEEKVAKARAQSTRGTMDLWTAKLAQKRFAKRKQLEEEKAVGDGSKRYKMADVKREGFAAKRLAKVEERLELDKDRRERGRLPKENAKEMAAKMKREGTGQGQITSHKRVEEVKEERELTAKKEERRTEEDENTEDKTKMAEQEKLGIKMKKELLAKERDEKMELEQMEIKKEEKERLVKGNEQMEEEARRKNDLETLGKLKDVEEGRGGSAKVEKSQIENDKRTALEKERLRQETKEEGKVEGEAMEQKRLKIVSKLEQTEEVKDKKVQLERQDLVKEKVEMGKVDGQIVAKTELERLGKFETTAKEKTKLEQDKIDRESLVRKESGVKMEQRFIKERQAESAGTLQLREERTAQKLEGHRVAEDAKSTAVKERVQSDQAPKTQQTLAKPKGTEKRTIEDNSVEAEMEKVVKLSQKQPEKDNLVKKTVDVAAEVPKLDKDDEAKDIGEKVMITKELMAKMEEKSVGKPEMTAKLEQQKSLMAKDRTELEIEQDRPKIISKVREGGVAKDEVGEKQTETEKLTKADMERRERKHLAEETNAKTSAKELEQQRIETEQIEHEKIPKEKAQMDLKEGVKQSVRTTVDRTKQGGDEKVGTQVEEERANAKLQDKEQGVQNQVKVGKQVVKVQDNISRESTDREGNAKAEGKEILAKKMEEQKLQQAEEQKKAAILGQVEKAVSKEPVVGKAEQERVLVKKPTAFLGQSEKLVSKGPVVGKTLEQEQILVKKPAAILGQAEKATKPETRANEKPKGQMQMVKTEAEEQNKAAILGQAEKEVRKRLVGQVQKEKLQQAEEQRKAAILGQAEKVVAKGPAVGKAVEQEQVLVKKVAATLGQAEKVVSKEPVIGKTLEQERVLVKKPTVILGQTEKATKLETKADEKPTGRAQIANLQQAEEQKKTAILGQVKKVVSKEPVVGKTEQERVLVKKPAAILGQAEKAIKVETKDDKEPKGQIQKTQAEEQKMATVLGQAGKVVAKGPVVGKTTEQVKVLVKAAGTVGQTEKATKLETKADEKPTGRAQIANLQQAEEQKKAAILGQAEKVVSKEPVVEKTEQERVLVKKPAANLGQAEKATKLETKANEKPTGQAQITNLQQAEEQKKAAILGQAEKVVSKGPVVGKAEQERVLVKKPAAILAQTEKATKLETRADDKPKGQIQKTQAEEQKMATVLGQAEKVIAKGPVVGKTTEQIPVLVKAAGTKVDEKPKGQIQMVKLQAEETKHPAILGQAEKVVAKEPMLGKTVGQEQILVKKPAAILGQTERATKVETKDEKEPKGQIQMVKTRAEEQKKAAILGQAEKVAAKGPGVGKAVEQEQVLVKKAAAILGQAEKTTTVETKADKAKIGQVQMAKTQQTEELKKATISGQAEKVVGKGPATGKMAGQEQKNATRLDLKREQAQREEMVKLQPVEKKTTVVISPKETMAAHTPVIKNIVRQGMKLQAENEQTEAAILKQAQKVVAKEAVVKKAFGEEQVAKEQNEIKPAAKAKVEKSQQVEEKKKAAILGQAEKVVAKDSFVKKTVLKENNATRLNVKNEQIQKEGLAKLQPATKETVAAILQKEQVVAKMAAVGKTVEQKQVRTSDQTKTAILGQAGKVVAKGAVVGQQTKAAILGNAEKVVAKEKPKYGQTEPEKAAKLQQAERERLEREKAAILGPAKNVVAKGAAAAKVTGQEQVATKPNATENEQKRQAHTVKLQNGRPEKAAILGQAEKVVAKGTTIQKVVGQRQVRREKPNDAKSVTEAENVQKCQEKAGKRQPAWKAAILGQTEKEVAKGERIKNIVDGKDQTKAAILGQARKEVAKAQTVSKAVGQEQNVNKVEAKVVEQRKAAILGQAGKAFAKGQAVLTNEKSTNEKQIQKEGLLRQEEKMNRELRKQLKPNEKENKSDNVVKERSAILEKAGVKQALGQEKPNATKITALKVDKKVSADKLQKEQVTERAKSSHLVRRK